MSCSRNRGSAFGNEEDGCTRFENTVCSCGRKARVKIAEIVNNKGRLYYLCDRGVCGSFLGWEKPNNHVVHEVTSEATTMPTPEIGDFRREITQTMVKMEKEVHSLRNMGQICVLMLLILIFLTVGKI